MKKLLLIFLCFPMIVFGQNNDTINIKNEINNLKNEVHEINYKMNEHYNQFSVGIIIHAIGMVAVIGGAVTSIIPLIYIGGGMSTVGNFLMLSSHKWFKNKKIPKENFRVQKRILQLNELLRKGSISQTEYHDAIKDLEELKR